MTPGFVLVEPATRLAAVGLSGPVSVVTDVGFGAVFMLCVLWQVARLQRATCGARLSFRFVHYLTKLYSLLFVDGRGRFPLALAFCVAVERVRTLRGEELSARVSWTLAATGPLGRGGVLDIPGVAASGYGAPARARAAAPRMREKATTGRLGPDPSAGGGLATAEQRRALYSVNFVGFFHEFGQE